MSTKTNGDGEEELVAVPASQRSSWTSFLKSIASFSGDLSSLTAPPFILSPVSLTEYPSYWCERPDLFAAIPSAADEEGRFLNVLKWFICTLKGQYTSRNDQMGSEKKPLNPVLGELFYGHWPNKNGRGRTNLVVEQVSHHPPITAYYISNRSKGLSLQGHNAQKTSFSGTSIIVKQIGHATLTCTLPDGSKERYLISLPRLSIAGLLTGRPYIELTDMSYIVSSTGYSSTIEYSGRGYFSGKAHTFKATVTKPGMPKYAPVQTSYTSSFYSLTSSGSSSANDSSIALYVFEGQWDTTSKDKRTGMEFTNVLSPKEEVTVAPISEETEEFESRRLWQKVAEGIRTQNYEVASREKSKIENEQRQRRKDEVSAGETWALKHFVRIERDPDYDQLSKLCPNFGPSTEDAYIYQFNAPIEEIVD